MLANIWKSSLEIFTEVYPSCVAYFSYNLSNGLWAVARLEIATNAAIINVNFSVFISGLFVGMLVARVYNYLLILIKSRKFIHLFDSFLKRLQFLYFFNSQLKVSQFLCLFNTGIEIC